MTNLKIGSVISGISELVTNKGVQKAIMGVYSDGTPRSLVDSVHGEVLSPKTKAKMISANKKRKKCNKKLKITEMDIYG